MITAESLRERDYAKKALKKETYKKILDSFFKKIKAGADSGKKYIVLKIPNFVLGCPMFNPTHATKYLTRQLQLCGYKVCFIEPQTLGVTWINNKPAIKPKPKPKPEKKTKARTEDLIDISSLMNLKKIANYYTRK